MTEPVIEQALYGSADGGYRFLARSPGFRNDWLAAAEQLCTAFGERPAEAGTCPACVFAHPFGAGYVAVVQAAERGPDDVGRPGTLGFHLLILPRRLYRQLSGDPFAVAEHFPPPWDARGPLPVLTWTGGPPPARTVATVERVLRRDEGPSLLGAAQVLVDGGRVVFERATPDTPLVRDLWTLLPTSTRVALWPASFAFANTLGFDALVVPRAAGATYAGYVTEDQAAEYPEGRYELNLQIAAEAGDQRELDALFARRSRAETWRLGLLLLAAALAAVLILAVTNPRSAPRKAQPTPASPALNLPPAEHFPRLSEPERQRLQEALRSWAEELGVAVPASATAEDLVTALDRHLGTPDPRRDPGDAVRTGPVERRLRALLWKHASAAYAERRLNPVELVERLQQQTAQPGR